MIVHDLIPACFSEQGGSQDEATVRRCKTCGDFSSGYREPRAKKRAALKKKEKYEAIFEEVENLEDLAPRMLETVVDPTRWNEKVASRLFRTFFQATAPALLFCS